MIGLGDIAKLAAKGEIGKAILEGGSAALKSVTSELMSKRDSSSTSSSSQSNLDIDSGSEIEEIAKNQGVRSNSLDPSQPTINEPTLEKADAPAIRIDGDDLVRSLTTLHSNIVNYLSVINRNSTTQFDYAKRKMSATDATVVSIKNTMSNFNKTVSGIEARLGRLESDVKNSESQKKAENLIPDRDDDRSDATKVSNQSGGGIVRDIEEYLTGAAFTRILGSILGSSVFWTGAGALAIIELGKYLGFKDRTVGPYSPQKDIDDANENLGVPRSTDKLTPAQQQQLDDIKSWQDKQRQATPVKPDTPSTAAPQQQLDMLGNPAGAAPTGLRPNQRGGVAPQASGITSFGPPDLARGQTLSPADLIAAMSAITGGNRGGSSVATKSSLPSPWQMIFGSGVRDRYGGGVGSYGTGSGARSQYGGGVSSYGLGNTSNNISGSLSEERKRKFAEELKDPAIRQRVFDIAANEQGTNAQGIQGVIETLMNRAAVSGHSLAQEARFVTEGGYYDDRQRRGRADPNNPVYQQALDTVMGGSNLSRFATDNSSGQYAVDQEGRGDFENRIVIHGEHLQAPGTKGNFSRAAWQKWVSAKQEQDQSSGIITPANASVGGDAVGGPIDPSQSNRPLHYQGSLQFGEDAYKFSTGGMGGHASIPYGDYPIDHSAGPWGQSVGALGLNRNSIFDPQSGRARAGIELHFGVNDNDLTEGCVAIAGGRWPELKAKIEARLQNGEHLYLHMTPAGAAIDTQQYLDTKQVAQKSQQQKREWGPGWLDVTKQQMTQQKDGTGITVPLSPQNAPTGYKQQTQAKPKSTNRGYRFIPGTIYDQMLQTDGTLKWSPSLIKGNEKGLAFYNALSPENKAAFDAGKLDFSKVTETEMNRLKAIDPNVGQAFQPIQNQVQAGMLPTGWLPSAASVISGAQSLFENWLDNPWLQKSPNHQVQNRWDDAAFGSVPDTRFSPMGGMITGQQTTESVPHLQTQRFWGATGQAPASGAAVHPAIRFTDSQGRPSAGSPAPAKIVTNPVHPGFGDYSHPDTSVFPAPPSDKPGMTTGKAVVPAVPHIDKQQQYDEARISNARPKTQITIPRHDPEQMEDQPGSRGYGQVRDPDRVGICSV